MDEINHFMHQKHSLKFFENLDVVVRVTDDNNDKNDVKKGVICCYGCQEAISDGSAYGCIPCHYFLHKKCAELRAIINHHIHPLHPLTLVDHGDLDWNCDVCRKDNFVGGFSYYCMQCNFDACTNCSVTIPHKEEELIKFQHEGHHPQHTLILQSRSASFLCDDCHSKDDGLLYICEDCDFWIHKTCTLLASTINLPHHHKHPLVLVYSLPDNFYKFEYFCEFCKRFILRNGWLYHCANCRYFTHIKCALDAEQIPSDALGTSDDEECINDFLQFPMSYAFTDPLKLLHLEKISLERDGATEITHWSHDHPLIFNIEPQGNNITNIGCNEPIKVCHGCVRPISFPYYSCKDGCLFTLHKYCVDLPLTLEHQLHPNHLLDLMNTYKDEDYYVCNGCFSNDNRFVYTCQTCKFYLDVNCAFLPNTIKHKSHKHPIIQVIDPDTRCKACYKLFDGISFACKTCKACNFRLDIFCALWSPHFLNHRYCKEHKIPLTYPPIDNHPEDFYCDVCEEEMHPKHPQYHCHKCKNSFHLECINRIDCYANVIEEGTIIVPYHKHPLTFVRREKTSVYVCFVCTIDINGRLILECRTRTCPFRICQRCHLKEPKEP